MYLKNDKIVATIKDLVMRSSRTSASTMQFVLDPTAILGWTEGTAARRDATPRAVSDGDFYEPVSMSSRLITLSGTAIAKDRAELQVMRDKFVGLLADGAYTTLEIETSVDKRYTTVGLEGTPSFVQQLDNVASFRLELYAPDPYIYGPENIISTGAFVTTGGLDYVLTYPLNYNIQGDNTAQTVTNHGNVDSWPVFKVTGDYYSGFSVEDNLGKVVTFDGMVSRQAPVFIDMARGTATQNGVDKTTLISRRDWFSIPPKQTLQPKFTPIQNGSGWCDIIYRDTWI